MGTVGGGYALDGGGIGEPPIMAWARWAGVFS